MRKIRTLIIAPYAEMSSLLSNVLEEYPEIEARIHVGSYEESIRAFPFLTGGMASDEFDILVARGYTAEQFFRAGFFPVVEIQTSLYDTLRSIKLAQNRQCPFAIVGSEAIIATARQLITILRIDNVTLKGIDSRDMAASEIRRLYSEGIRLIVGDLFAVDACQNLGMDSILITSGKASVQQTFENVRRLYQNIHATSRHNAVFRDALECSGHSVLIYNSDQHLIFSNLAAGRKIPDRLLESMPGWLSKMDKEDTLTIRKFLNGTMYKIMMKRSVRDHIYFIVHIRPYEKQAHLPVPDFLHFINPIESFEGDISSEEMATAGTFHVPAKRLSSGRFESILFYGEVGTGKEYLARKYWQESRFSKVPLWIVNCDLVSEEKWDQLADNPESVLFELDYAILFKNVQKLSPAVQSLLNDFMESTDFRRHHLVMCTSDVHLNQLIAKGTFLPELYHKIAEFEQYLPSLNEDPNMIRTIAEKCISQYSVSINSETIGFDADAMETLQSYHWKYNIPQLQDVVRYVLSQYGEAYISSEQIRKALSRYVNLPATSSAGSIRLTGTMAEIQAQVAKMVVDDCGGNVSAASKRLGISRTTLWRLIRDKGTSNQAEKER